MIVWIFLGFALLAAYEYALLAKVQASPKQKTCVYGTIAISLVYCLIAYFAPAFANPNPLIEAVFGDIQDWIQLKG